MNKSMQNSIRAFPRSAKRSRNGGDHKPFRIATLCSAKVEKNGTVKSSMKNSK